MTRLARMMGGSLALMASSIYIAPALVRAQMVSPPALTTLPVGYREWRLISVAHEEGKQNDIRAILGNDIAFKAAREGRRVYPNGAVIARLAWRYISSEENNKAFGQTQSFTAGAPTNVQLMVKDAIRYKSTGGWSFVQFDGGKLTNPEKSPTCFACHAPVKSRDYVFNRYSP